MNKTMSNLTMPYSQLIYFINLNNEITKSYVITTTIIGISCNVISAIVFSRLIDSRTNMGILCLMQSIVDLVIFVVYFLLIRSSPLLFPISIESRSNISCKLIAYIRSFTLHASSWTTVLITFDRFVSIVFPHRYEFLRKRRNLAIVVISTFLLLAILNAPNLWFYINSGFCTSSYSVLVVTELTYNLVRTYIPLFLMTLFNIIMIRKIFKSSRIAGKQQTSSNFARIEYQFTWTVIAFDVYFFVTNFPQAIFNTMFNLRRSSGALKPSDLTSFAYFNLLSGIFLDISLLQQTLAFFFNIVFNRLFREEILRFCGRFLPCCRRFSRGNRVHNIEVNTMARLKIALNRLKNQQV